MATLPPTEGEWKWHWRYEDGKATGSVFAEPREGHAYAVAICPQYQTREQWEVDASILAAGKDMLAALKRCEEMVSANAGPPDWDWIRSIIAKAEGR